MAKVDIPILDEDVDTPTEKISAIVTDQGTIRLSELRDELNLNDHQLRLALFELLERGDLALFPIGDSVQVRDES
jgi:hypothetical protein